MTGTGNAPVSERAWPVGSVKVANLSARLGWWEGPPFGGGEWHFEYRGDTDAFQEALDFFSRIGSPALDLFIHDGTQSSFVLVATITDARTGAAVAGARFQVTGRDDAGGYARPLTNAVAVVGYDDLPERVYRKFAVALARAGTFSGRVVDTAGAPVGNARVLVANTLLGSNVPYRALHKSETLPDGAGRFTLTNVPVGLVQLRAWLSGYYQTNALYYHTVPGAKVALVVAATGALVMQVRDAAGRGTGEWKQQVLQVSVEPSTAAVVGNWGASANLRPDGTCRFTEVHPGSYLVKLLNTLRQATVLVLPNQMAEVSFQWP